MLTPLLTFCAFVTGLLHIGAEYQGPRRAVYLLKPLTTTLILVLAYRTTPPVSSFYQATILWGLLFSLIGDIFLMLPTDQFIAGLVSFLLAHLCYIAAFTGRSGFHSTWWLLAPFMLYGIGIIYLLWSHVGSFKAPVLLYMAVILTMGWQAAEQWRWVEQTGARLALLGAILFIISDSALALDRFYQPYKLAKALVLGAYYVAQWLIARSVM